MTPAKFQSSELPVDAASTSASEMKSEAASRGDADQGSDIPWWQAWSEPCLAWGVTRLLCVIALYLGWLFFPMQGDYRFENPAAGPHEDLAVYYRAWAEHPEKHDGSPMLGLELGGKWKWLSPLVRWDSFWYLSIAEVGYVMNREPDNDDAEERSAAERRTTSDKGSKERREQNFVFFPVYPLMIRLFAVIGIHPALAGVLISNVCTLLTSCLLYELVRRVYHERVARWTVWSWLLFPASFFGTVAYSDSMMALAVVGAMWYVYRERYLAAGLIAGLTSAMRPPGLLLGLTLMDGWAKRHWWKPLVGMMFSGVGLALYFCYLGSQFGDPLIYFKAVGEWGNMQAGAARWDPLGWFFKVFHSLQYSLMLISAKQPLGHYYSWRVADPWMFAWILFYLPTVRKMGWGQSLFSLTMILLLLTGATSLASIGRYCWVILPIFVAAGLRLSQSRLRWPMVAAMLVGLMWCATLFGGYWEII